MTGIPGRLTIGADGKLRGPADIAWNDPFPTGDGTPGGFGTPYGGVIHTEVGFEHGTIAEFNTPAAQASAFFSIGMDGRIHQYGPLGQNWMAWTQVDGNPNWRGVEHEDKGHPETPMPPAQIAASAQVFEAMSTFDGSLGNPWPLEATDDVHGRGIIFHSDGGVAWGNHDCPGPVRRGQRAEIIALARQIRAGWEDYVTTGAESLVQIAAACGGRADVTAILQHTMDAAGLLVPHLKAYVDAGNLAAPVPRRTTIRVPAGFALPARHRPVRGAVLAAARAARKGAAAAGTAGRAEPVMTAGLAAGLLSAALVLAGHLGYLHLTAAQSGAVLTAITAVAGAVAAARTRPVRVGAVTAALSALAVAAGAFGLHLPAAWIGYQMPVASLIVASLLRLHVSPKGSPAKAAAPGSVMLPTLTQRFEADFGQVHTALDKVLAHARQAAGAVDAVTPAAPQNTMSGPVTVQNAGPVPGTAASGPVQILAVTGGTATAQAAPPPAAPIPVAGAPPA